MSDPIGRRTFGQLLGAAALRGVMPERAGASTRTAPPAGAAPAAWPAIGRSNDLCALTAVELVSRIRARQLSAREVMAAHLARIEHVNLAVNAIVTLVAERAMVEAAKARRGAGARSRPGRPPRSARWPTRTLWTRRGSGAPLDRSFTGVRVAWWRGLGGIPFEPEIAQAERSTGADVARALGRQTSMYAQSRRFFEQYDYFVLPVTQVALFDVTTPYPTQVAGSPMATYIDWMRSCWYDLHGEPRHLGAGWVHGRRPPDRRADRGPTPRRLERAAAGARLRARDRARSAWPRTHSHIRTIST